jgi:hypothetical protein
VPLSTEPARSDKWGGSFRLYRASSSRRGPGARARLTSRLTPFRGLAQTKDHPKSWAEFLDHIDGIELYGPEDRADATLRELVFDPVDTLDCLLWLAGNDRVALDRVNALIASVSDHAASEPMVRVLAVDPRPDRTLVRLVATEALLAELLDNVDVERLRAPRAVITPGALISAAMPDELPEPATTVIGIVDGVINITNPLTGPHVLAAEQFPAGYAFSGAHAHGTAVTERLFGVIWTSWSPAGRYPCRIP